MKGNKPLDRDYFKRKANPNAKKGPQLTECCKQDVDRNILNKNNKNDWELIEDYCEETLQSNSGTETITPVCCKVCGRLIEYVSTLNYKSWK
tara:strand:+ start:510 stop:785 length:276 start_codon:yes stop_codon:yes gene_type:complete